MFGRKKTTKKARALPKTVEVPVVKVENVEAPIAEESPFEIRMYKGAYIVSKNGRDIHETDTKENAEKFIKERP